MTPKPLGILIAPNALKGSLSARAAAQAIANGIDRVAPDALLRMLPVADGGDGLLEVLEQALGGVSIVTQVTGPLGSPVHASFIYSETRRLALLEMASAAGLALLTPDQYNPLRTTTRGVGELIKAALDHGARQILLGIGGSATNDGGIGMAAALGVVFRDAEGRELEPLAEQLPLIATIDTRHLDPRLRDTCIQVICDVGNPLLGPQGATYTFGPQKGAAPDLLPALEAGLHHLADLISRQLGVSVYELPGGGAAGGLGAGARAFLQAELRPGTEVVFDLLEFDTALVNADLVITAEGRLDVSTLQGKAPMAVARHARQQGIPCIALAGSLGDDLSGLSEAGFSAWYGICPAGMPLETAMRQAESLLAGAAERAMRDFLRGIPG